MYLTLILMTERLFLSDGKLVFKLESSRVEYTRSYLVSVLGPKYSGFL